MAPSWLFPGSASGPWTPASDSGLLNWWDAADSATITQSGGAISQWNDKGSRGWNATQSGTNKPTVATADLNGRDTIAFDSKEALDYGASHIAVNTTQPFYILFVLKKTGTAAGLNVFFTVTDEQDQTIGSYFEYQSGAYQLVMPHGHGWVGAKFTATPGSSYHLLEFIYNGSGAGTLGNYSANYDRSSQTLSSTADDWVGPNAIGSYFTGIGSNNYWIGNIAEIVVSSSTNLGSNYQSYVSTKWGI